MRKEKTKKITQAMTFIIIMGVVSLFSDMTHEGASSIRGEYLSLLGASASVIGFVSGLGELVGYGLRFVFGRITDKTKKYWFMTILGYFIDVVCVPTLALVNKNGWIWACVLLILERTGKAIKKPAKSTIVSFAASQEGAGKSFAVQEALDQIGAFLGPVMLYFVLKYKQGTTLDKYSAAFAFLTIPAVLTMVSLFFAKKKFPNPENFEPESKKTVNFRKSPSFILYIAGISFFSFGFIDFSLVTMHVANNHMFTDSQLPLIYALAMIVDAVSALFFGNMYDKKGFSALVWSTVVSSLFSLFIFGFQNKSIVMLGIILWGIGMGAQESILKAAVSTMIPKASRAAGYGIFELSFGLFWFLGSWILGILYEKSIIAMITLSVVSQLISVPFYIISEKKIKSEQNSEN